MRLLKSITMPYQQMQDHSLNGLKIIIRKSRFMQ